MAELQPLLNQIKSKLAHFKLWLGGELPEQLAERRASGDPTVPHTHALPTKEAPVPSPPRKPHPRQLGSPLSPHLPKGHTLPLCFSKGLTPYASSIGEWIRHTEVPYTLRLIHQGKEVPFEKDNPPSPEALSFNTPFNSGAVEYASLLIIPDGVVLTRDGAIITPDNVILGDHNVDARRVTEFLLIRVQNALMEYLQPKGQHHQYLDGRAIVLTHMWGWVYGHFLLESITRMRLFEVCPEAYDYIILPDDAPPIAETLFEKLGIPREKLVFIGQNEVIQVRELIYPSTYRRDPYQEKKNYDWIREKFTPEDAPTDITPGKWIYWKRTDQRLKNQDDVIALLAAYGITTYDYSTMTFDEQVRVFMSAEGVFCNHGSGLINLVFCHPGKTHVFEFVQKQCNAYLFSIMAQQQGLPHQFVFTDMEDESILQQEVASHHHKAIMPLPRLETFLRQLCQNHPHLKAQHSLKNAQQYVLNQKPEPQPEEDETTSPEAPSEKKPVEEDFNRFPFTHQKSILSWLQTTSVKAQLISCNPGPYTPDNPMRIKTGAARFKDEDQLKIPRMYPFPQYYQSVLIIPNGIAYGDYGPVLTPDRAFLTDHLLDFRGLTNPFTRTETLTTTEHLQTHPETSFHYIPGRIVCLTSVWPYIYGHFLMENLPRMMLVDKMNIPYDGILVPRQAVPHIEAYFKPTDTLHIMDRHTAVMADELIWPSNVAPINWENDEIIAWLKARFLPTPEPLNRPRRRIFWSRGLNDRRISNEAELHPVLESFGIEILSFKDYSLTEQAQMFADAELVVCQHGSGLCNQIYCQPGTQILEIIQFSEWEDMASLFRDMARHLKLDHHILISDTVEQHNKDHRSHYDKGRMPSERLAEKLQAMLGNGDAET